jgi:hypothetical protein
MAIPVLRFFLNFEETFDDEILGLSPFDFVFNVDDA